jgi:hypothetical protein
MVRLLHLMNVLAALILGVVALYMRATQGQRSGLILLGALMVVGPVEDLLVRWYAATGPTGSRAQQVIDKGTSLVLILGMIAATLLR